jgi:hypothetical protein
MCVRAASLPVLIDHPASGTLNSPEFAARCVGVTVHGYVRIDELWAIARVLDSGANEILAAGAYEDTSPAVTFAPGTGARIHGTGRELQTTGAVLRVSIKSIPRRGKTLIWVAFLANHCEMRRPKFSRIRSGQAKHKPPMAKKSFARCGGAIRLADRLG